ncbi:MAG: beta-ketoacyl-[acyl-carrier-protein] synthase family protein [Tannerella sp.]|jgi:3-oxoacyl-[acyl-carrier-protein] synthase-1|nr:beta-ketoacyl-[acyl-carrier-protein] synthase family protein [Tannerella sp.]
MKAKEAVYVTGAGVVSAIGLGQKAVLDALRGGRSGVEPVRYLRTVHSDFPVGEVKYGNGEMQEMLRIAPGEATIRSSLLGMLAVGEALRQYAPSGGRDETLRVALVSGITVGGMDQVENMYDDFVETDLRNDYISLIDCGACTEQIADYFGGFRMASTIVTACSSSANAIMAGIDLLREDRADVVVAGGCECLSRYHVNGFNTLMILDRETCRPFDRRRAGINLGEGAGYLVLEPAEAVSRRGGQPLGKVSGYCNACDAYHQTASSPEGLGAYLAMKGAIEDAGLTPEDIDYVNAHGTGTPNNDLTEGLAIMRLFGERIPPVASVKAFTGHTTSAAGSLEAVISLLALRHGFLPVNLNFREPIEEHSFVPVTDPSPGRPLRHVLSNSFGFGGNCSSIVFSNI